MNRAVAMFERRGFAVLRESMIDSFIDAVDAFDNALQLGGGTAHRFGDELVKIPEPSELDPLLWNLAHDAHLAEIAANLMRWDQCWLFGDSLYYKKPSANNRSQVGFHQDLRYWPMLNGQAQLAVTAVVPLYFATRESGGLGFVPGSHRWPLLGGDAWAGSDNAGEHVTPAPPAGEMWVEEYPVIDPGQVSFHHPLTFHGSLPNTTEQHRRSITIHLTCAPEFGRALLWRRD